MGMVINPIVKIYIPIIRFPIEGGMTILTKSLDPGIHVIFFKWMAQPQPLCQLIKKTPSPILCNPGWFKKVIPRLERFWNPYNQVQQYYNSTTQKQTPETVER